MVNKWKDKEFIKVYNKDYQQKNKERIKSQRKEYNSNPKVKKHKQEYDRGYNNLLHIKIKCKKYRQQYYLKNKKKILTQTKEYKSLHKERIKKHNREYNQRENVKRRDNKNRKIRKKEEVSYSIKCKLRSRLWSVLKKYSKTGKIMSSKQYGINYNDIIEQLKPFPKDISNYDVDHIIPLSRFELTNPEEVKKAFAPENHAWLTKEANRSKGNRLVHPDYYKR